jgi:hypothetical protein
MAETIAKGQAGLVSAAPDLAAASNSQSSPISQAASTPEPEKEAV